MLSKKDNLQKNNSSASAVAESHSNKGISLPAVPALQRFKESREEGLSLNLNDTEGRSESGSLSAFMPVQGKEGAVSPHQAIQRVSPVQLKKKKPVAVEAEAEEEVTPEVTPSATADQLETSFDEKAEELSTAMTEAAEAYNPGNIERVVLTGAPAKSLALGSLLGELSAIVDSIDERSGEVSTELGDESLDDDTFGSLTDESGKFETLIPKVKAALYKVDNKVTEFQGMIDVEKERRAANGAVAAALTALRALWASAALAKGHFNKHKGDTGLGTESDYLTRAKELTAKSPGGDILRKTRSDGDILYYDKSNGNFAIKSSAGKIRTLFSPSGGEGYYNKQ